MPTLEVRQYYSPLESGVVPPYTVLAKATEYAEAHTVRKTNGMRLASYHAMPITLDLWEWLPVPGSDTEYDWYKINSLTTEVKFTLVEDPE